MSRRLRASINEFALDVNEEKSLDALIEAIGDAEYVLLGESTHGTSEFYEIRVKLSKRLIKEKGFSIIAVEGDWPSAQEVNRYIKGFTKDGTTVEEVLRSFDRWPTWMWANEEIARFTKWLKMHNADNQNTEKVGFYGIDLYSLYESIDEVLRYLKEVNPSGGDLELAKKAFSCFEPYNRMPDHYALSTAHFTDECVHEVSSLLTSIRNNEEKYADAHEEALNLKMNALVAKNAEAYYRAMLHDDTASWNIRDIHMTEAINEVRNHHGAQAKIIVWEHNTHIGDATETSMEKDGMVNVGQLLREQNSNESIFAIGFGTHRGTVIAAENWGAPHQVIDVPIAKKNTWEDQLQQVDPKDKVILFNDENRHLFNEWIGHRAIGVVYNPEFEAYGNYVTSRVGSRYDAFIFVEETTALHPLY